MVDPIRRRIGPVRLGLAALGIGTASVVAHNAWRVLALRRDASALRRALDHDGVVGGGLGEPTELWVLGDSASDGFGLERPEDAFPAQVAHELASRTGRRVRLTAVGKDGARIADVTATQVPLLSESADAVAVLVGANDVFGRRSARQVERDARAMVEAITSRAPTAILVVAGCPDFGRAPGFPQPLRSLLGWRCRVTAAAIERACATVGVPFVDIVPDTRPDLFGEDGVHPNREAGAAMAPAVVGCLVEAGTARVELEG